MFFPISLTITCLVILIIAIYYTFFNKQVKQKWSTFTKSAFYFGVVVASLIIIWQIIYFIITRL